MRLPTTLGCFRSLAKQRPTVNGETPDGAATTTYASAQRKRRSQLYTRPAQPFQGRAERDRGPLGSDGVEVRPHRASPARNGAVRRPGAPFRPLDEAEAIGGLQRVLEARIDETGIGYKRLRSSM